MSGQAIDETCLAAVPSGKPASFMESNDVICGPGLVDDRTTSFTSVRFKLPDQWADEIGSRAGAVPRLIASEAVNVVDVKADATGTIPGGAVSSGDEKGAENVLGSLKADLRGLIEKSTGSQCGGTATEAVEGKGAVEAVEMMESAVMCPICLEVMECSSSVVPCMHTFDVACISRWLTRSSACPQCRGNVVELRPNHTVQFLCNYINSTRPDPNPHKARTEGGTGLVPEVAAEDMVARTVSAATSGSSRAVMTQEDIAMLAARAYSVAARRPNRVRLPIVICVITMPVIWLAIAIGLFHLFS